MAGDWRLEGESWRRCAVAALTKLETGGWKLETGCCCPIARSRMGAGGCRLEMMLLRGAAVERGCAMALLRSGAVVALVRSCVPAR